MIGSCDLRFAMVDEHAPIAEEAANTVADLDAYVKLFEFSDRLMHVRDLTELLPQDAWLQALSLEPQGVELIGQADAASPLIQRLEGSPWLERVEFTSPVTKTQSKDQFRLRASWERR